MGVSRMGDRVYKEVGKFRSPEQGGEGRFFCEAVRPSPTEEVVMNMVACHIKTFRSVMRRQGERFMDPCIISTNHHTTNRGPSYFRQEGPLNFLS